RPLLHDRGAERRDGVERRPEVRGSFAGGLARALELERVERVAAVRDLERAAGPPRGSEELRPDPGARARLPRREERRPEGRTAPGAHALSGPVLLEEVERAAARVDATLHGAGTAAAGAADVKRPLRGGNRTHHLSE